MSKRHFLSITNIGLQGTRVSPTIDYNLTVTPQGGEPFIINTQFYIPLQKYAWREVKIELVDDGRGCMYLEANPILLPPKAVHPIRRFKSKRRGLRATLRRFICE